MNAVRFQKGMWYPMLQNGTWGPMIDFRHFEHFDPNSGWDGASLEWHPKYGSLKPVSMWKKVKPLCGAPKFTSNFEFNIIKCSQYQRSLCLQ